MPRKRKTGDGDPYSDAEEAAVADAIERAYLDDTAAWGEEEGPDVGMIDVEAQIEWAGNIDNNGRGGVRRTRLDGVQLGQIRQAAARLDQARHTGPDSPYRSYQAKGWQAQLRRTLSTKRGREAAARAGLNPGTIRRWRSGGQKPGPASRAKISGVYDRLRDPRTASVAEARRDLSNALTGALRQRYGVNVRLRDIRHLTIEGE